MKSNANALEAEWVKANPRPHWTPEFWAACRPVHETKDEDDD